MDIVLTGTRRYVDWKKGLYNSPKAKKQTALHLNEYHLKSSLHTIHFSLLQFYLACCGWLLWLVVAHGLNPEWEEIQGVKYGAVSSEKRRANLMPGVAQVVAISVGHSDERLDGVNVLLLHLCDARAGCQQGEPCQGLHICIPLQLRQQDQRVCKNTAR